MGTLAQAGVPLLNVGLLLIFLVFGSGVEGQGGGEYLGQPQIREYKFDVRYLDVYPDCVKKTIPAINKQFPGPKIEITEGDTLVVHVRNFVNETISIHWHGFVQNFEKGGNPWADGPSYITQCPIPPGGSFTYKMVVDGQRGTFFYHGHKNYLIGDLFGPIVVNPRPGAFVPYKKPEGDHFLLLTGWHHEQMESIYKRELERVPPIFEFSEGQALLINGRGKYKCPANNSVVPCQDKQCAAVPCVPNAPSCQTPVFNVIHGKTYRFRIANVAWGAFLRFGIAGHSMWVVEADGGYTKFLKVKYINISPGQSFTVLVKMNKKVDNYWMASALRHDQPQPQTGPALAILRYHGAPPTDPSGPLPTFPPFSDRNATLAQTRALHGYGKFPLAGMPVVKRVRFVPSFGRVPVKQFIAGAINNVSMPEPTTPLLAAEYYKIPGVFTTDFPDNFAANVNVLNPPPGQLTNVEPKDRSIRLLQLPYNGVVEIVIQNAVTVIANFNNFSFFSEHPFHTHGYTFYTMGTGLGLWDPKKDPQKYNLVDPPELYTAVVPAQGWTAIRFKANNPGVWLFHCHIQTHMSSGMRVAFLVRRPDGYLPPPPKDTPKCGLFTK